MLHTSQTGITDKHRSRETSLIPGMQPYPPAIWEIQEFLHTIHIYSQRLKVEIRPVTLLRR